MIILVGQKRSKSDPSHPYIPQGKTEPQEYDNVLLSFIELDRFGNGLVLPRNDRDNVAKIKYVDFEEMVGYSYEDFDKNFRSFFFGRELIVHYERRYNDFAVCGVEIGEEPMLELSEAAQKIIQDMLDLYAEKAKK